jgi:type I restriction enzyme S subunit
LRDFRLRFAPPSEQHRIVEKVEVLLGQASRACDRITRVARVLGGANVAALQPERLKQAILSKAFSGELVPTEADLARAEGRTYETAEELLERVRRERENGTEAGAGRRAPRGGGRASKRREG